MNSLNNKNCSQNSTYNILSYMVNCFLIIIITMQNVCNRFIIHSEVNVMWPYLNPLRRGIELLHLLITVTLQNLSVMFMWQWENSWVGIISHYADFSFVFALILFFSFCIKFGERWWLSNGLYAFQPLYCMEFENLHLIHLISNHNIPGQYAVTHIGVMSFFIDPLTS